MLDRIFQIDFRVQVVNFRAPRFAAYSPSRTKVKRKDPRMTVAHFMITSEHDAINKIVYYFSIQSVIVTVPKSPRDTAGFTFLIFCVAL